MRRLLFFSRSRGTRILTRGQLLALTALLLPFAWCFAAVLISDRTLAFRDAANFYYPLFEWESSEWAAGRVPLWNLFDNGGTPVAGEATASVFYPGKLLFALPLSFSRCYSLYLTLHVLLAAAGTYRLARHWGASSEAAGLSGVAYAFGGTVLFQYCNVVFLIGASWLPFACRAADRMITGKSIRWALNLASVLALMVLGGDPQMAYHAGLLAVLLAWLDFRNSTCGGTHSGEPGHEPGHEPGRPDREAHPTPQQRQQDSAPGAGGATRTRSMLLAVAGGGAMLLSAVQVVPGLAATRNSERMVSQVPRSVYEWGAGLFSPARGPQRSAWHAAYDGFFAAPEPGTHHAHIYTFSVGPWRFLELLWPNCYGRLFPLNQRWITALPAEGRTWSPSMYLGLLPLLMGLSGWNLRADCPRRVWLSWMVLAATLASLGGFGLGWIAEEVRVGFLGGKRADALWGHPVGGLYWLMVVLLPGYVYFRYPAKLLVIAALGICLLAAGQWDQALRRPWFRRCLFVVSGISLTLAVAVFLSRAIWYRWTAHAPADAVFGPLVQDAAWRDLVGGLLHTALVASVIWFAVSQFRLKRRTLGQVVLLVTCFDLLSANCWMTRSIPAQLWREPPAVAAEISRHAAANSGSFRVVRDALGPPAEWAVSSSSGRLHAVVDWEHKTVLPKHHLRGRLALVEAAATLPDATLNSLLQVARRNQLQQAEARRTPGRSLLDALSTEYFLLAADSKAEDLLKLAAESLPSGSQLCWNPHSFPKAWLVHRVHVVPRLHRRDPASLKARSEEVLGPAENPRDFRREVVLETDDELRLIRPPPIDRTASETCRLLSYGAQHITLEVTLNTSGCVVINDSYDPGWQVWIHSGESRRRGTIYRANRVMRAVLLPPGKHRLDFRYRPTLLYFAGACSILSWTAVSCAWCFSWLRHGRPGLRSNGTEKPVPAAEL